MRVVSVISAVVSVVLMALTLVPAASDFRWHLSVAAIAASVVVLVSLLAGGRRGAEPKPVEPASAEAVKPAAIPVASNQAEAEVVNFIALLQEKGRFVDFLMDDIMPYADAQVGAAARVVHEGCRAVLQEHFGLRPVREESEGATITVDASCAADEYRLVGKIAGQSPFTGRLVHHGWRAETMKLPRILRPADDRLPTIAPAEIELS